MFKNCARVMILAPVILSLASCAPAVAGNGVELKTVTEDHR